MAVLSALKNNKQRIITGLALVSAISLIGYVDNFFLTWFALGGIYLLAFDEAVKLYKIQTHSSLYFFALLIWFIAAFYPYGDDLFVLAGMAYASAVSFNKNLHWRDFLPFIYPTAGMLFILTMYQEYGIISLFWLLMIVAMTDIGAYAVGKSIGKTMLSKTSPNKTWEGAAGGVIIATLSGMFIGVGIVDLSISFVISLMVSIISIFGDLFESSLKRTAGVKDSGHLLPGHGGVLDRIDGYLFGAIIMLVLMRGLV